jgi:opacity protein-like surface antigen
MVVTLRKILISVAVLAIGGVAFADGDSYGDAIKDTPEYKKITGQDDDGDENRNDDRREDRRSHRDRRYRRVPSGPVYIDGYHDVYTDQDDSVYQNYGYFPDGSTPEAGFNAFYIGLSIGTASFDYDDIDDVGALLLFAGFRTGGERQGYEFSYINTGAAEVSGLDDIELRVEALIFSLTWNSSKSMQSRWNAYGSAGIYLAGTTLSGPVDEVDEDSNGFTLGAGVEYAINRQFKLRLDARKLMHVEDFVSDKSVSVLSFGGKLGF